MTDTIKLDGIDLPIRPTPLAQMLDSLEAFANGVNDRKAAEALAKCVFAGIRRAKGEVTLEFVQENIDTTNMDEVFEVFARVNKLERKVKQPGEVPAGQAS